MLSQPKIIYVKNKELLEEIHKSKKTYCYFVDPRYSDYNTIVDNVEKVTLELAQEVMDEHNNKPRKTEDFVPIESVDDVVFRVMTHEHIPLCDDKKKRSRSIGGEGRLRTNFPPFKHYVFIDGVLTEVGRSHWKDALHNGDFSQDHGRLTNGLARRFDMMASKLAMKSCYRSYSYVQEMKQSAVLQLVMNGLQFDEFRGNNPFAFYTTTLKHAFTRVLNLEKRHRDIRDDLLVMAGANPSHTRQFSNEQSQRPPEPAVKDVLTLPAKRGRKPKEKNPQVEV